MWFPTWDQVSHFSDTISIASSFIVVVAFLRWRYLQWQYNATFKPDEHDRISYIYEALSPAPMCRLGMSALFTSVQGSEPGLTEERLKRTLARLQWYGFVNVRDNLVTARMDSSQRRLRLAVLLGK